ncbi:MAG: histidine kinase [Bacteroidia bacterium]|nr:histidine kinase [Bacteroidia bacterium]
MVNKVRLYWGLQIGGWAIFAIAQIVAVLELDEGSLTNQRIIFLLYEAAFGLAVSHVYRNFINRWKWLSLTMPRLIPRVLFSVFVMGVIMYFIRIPVSIPLGLFNKNVVLDPIPLLGLSFVYAFFFFLWSVLYFIYNYFERYNKSLKLEASIKEIELNNLKSQLNPHFIFNALNSIRALVDENPSKSKQAINQLANILRNSLVTEKRGLTKFEDELRIVKDYLGLEGIRFEERLKTEMDIDSGSSEFLVPPLMIQTLVENGIKHGISKLKNGGIVQIKTRVENNRLKIHIRNSGHLQLNGTKRTSGGMGLKNTRQRLKLIYGDEASFRILAESNTFVLTEIIIPHLYKI